MEQLVNAIARLVEDAPDALVLRIIDALTVLDERERAAASSRLRAISTSGQTRRWIDSLLGAWDRNKIDQHALALAIASARETRRRLSESFELVWTGPAVEQTAPRRSDQAMYELIEGAQHELLLVSYVLYPEFRWQKAIEQALGRGVQIRLILDTLAEGGGVGQLWESIRSRIACFTWDPGIRAGVPGGGALHAKCLVADRTRALITSANLTARALISNMELGVTIGSGQTPENIVQLFDELIQRKTIIPI
ncbi:MAG: DISARM system phospholipase D-like protein DrmC [Thermomicrobiales bacterium]